MKFVFWPYAFGYVMKIAIYAEHERGISSALSVFFVVVVVVVVAPK